jgi:hypothetical protein
MTEGEPLDDGLPREESEDQYERRRQAGRLIEEHEGVSDDEKDEVADEAGEDKEGLSAEEAAVRIDRDARGGTDHPDDRYVQEP